MPPIKPCNSVGLIIRAHNGLVERLVGLMVQLCLINAFVVVYHPIANELNLGHSGDSFEMGVQNRLLLAFCLVVSVTIVFRFWVECLCTSSLK